LNVRFGSKADILVLKCDVCFTPKSGHCRPTVECPLSAKSRRTPRTPLARTGSLPSFGLSLRWSTPHKAPSQLTAHIQHCPRRHCACDYKANSEVILSVQHRSLSMSYDGKLVAGHLFHCAKGHNAHANDRGHLGRFFHRSVLVRFGIFSG
jgi:hypothetical protein